MTSEFGNNKYHLNTNNTDDNDKIIKHIFEVSCDHLQNANTINNIHEKIKKRFDLGRERYGHGLIINSDVSQWTQNKKDDWLEMAYEEFYDGLIYLSAAYFRKKESGSCNDNELHKITKSMIFLLLGIEVLKDE